MNIIIARDINGRIIHSTDRVKLVGNCHKTNNLYSISETMEKFIRNGKCFSDINIISEEKISFGGYYWHPSDVQIESKPIHLPPQ